MAHLCILVEEPLSFTKLETRLTAAISVGGSAYRERPIPDNDAVFYDWIIDEADVVRGLEIHLPPDDPLLKSSVPLTSVSLIETDCFVQIWFGKNRVGAAKGKEAFGDIFFFETEGNNLAIVVGLDFWLSPWQGENLLGELR